MVVLRVKKKMNNVDKVTKIWYLDINIPSVYTCIWKWVDDGKFQLLMRLQPDHLVSEISQ